MHKTGCRAVPITHPFYDSDTDYYIVCHLWGKWFSHVLRVCPYISTWLAAVCVYIPVCAPSDGWRSTLPFTLPLSMWPALPEPPEAMSPRPQTCLVEKTGSLSPHRAEGPWLRALDISSPPQIPVTHPSTQLSHSHRRGRQDTGANIWQNTLHIYLEIHLGMC